MTTFLVNDQARGTVGQRDTEGPAGFHAGLPGYARSPLVGADGLAAALGVGQVWIKDESSRMGLPSFKILGASWATFRALQQRAGRPLEGWAGLDELAALVHGSTPVRRLAAATDGNHGRAVARVGAWLGLGVRIFVPAGMSEARIAAIRSEGATVDVVEGSYEAAVRRSAEEAADDCLVVSDTSWPGYEDVPNWVIDGYATIFAEIADQLAEQGAGAPDLVVVQMGVGALAAAVVRYHRREGGPGSRVLGVEPDGAACVMASVRAGAIATVPGPHPSIMVGLNCDTPSLVAWPDMLAGVDAFVAVDDDAARAAMRDLARIGVVSGETGAAGLAGLTAAVGIDGAREALGLTADSTVLVLSTEGDTDPLAYRQIVGESAPARAGRTS